MRSENLCLSEEMEDDGRSLWILRPLAGDPGSGISGGNGAVWPLQRVYTAVCVSAGPGDQPCNSAGGPAIRDRVA